MRGKIIATHLTILLCAVSSFGYANKSLLWKREAKGITDPNISIVKIHPADDSLIFIGVNNLVYKSSDSGANYQKILQISGNHSSVNDIAFSSEDPKKVYVATNSGLYETIDSGRNWKEIYDSSDEKAGKVLAVILNNQTFYLGTRKGIYKKDVNESSWSKFQQNLNNESVNYIRQDREYVYFATNNELYSFQEENRQLRKIFSKGINQSSLLDEGSESEKQRQIKYLELDHSQDGHIYLATTSAIYFSQNHGFQWVKLPSDSLPYNKITSLAVLKSNQSHGLCQDEPTRCVAVLAGTLKGAFLYREGQWKPVYKGMETNQISYLAKSKRGSVYAATSKGIFYLDAVETLPLHKSEGFSEERKFSKRNFRLEPSIQEVHKLAIDYADVSPQKINEWKKLARRKAILPDLSVGLDRADSDLYHWDTGQKPDVLLKGKDYLDWDISVSWDLADLIWSTDQTTIDSRSKLMVELREDILDQITRLYFERRRTQIELAMLSHKDIQQKFEKEMRIEELTALIDGFTGGKFSELIGKSHQLMIDMRDSSLVTGDSLESK